MTEGRTEDTARHGVGSLLPIVGRRLRRDGVALALIAGVVLLTSVLLAGTPRFLDDLSTRGLRFALDEAHPAERSVRITQYFNQPSGESEAWLSRTSTAMQEKLPELLRSVDDNRDMVIDSGEFKWLPLGPEGTDQDLVTDLRAQPDITDHAQVMEGRWPDSTAEEMLITSEISDRLPPITGMPRSDEWSSPVVEVAVAEDPATQLDLAVDDELILFPQPATGVSPDPSSRGDRPVVARIVGILRLDPLTDPYWFGDAALHDAGVIEAGQGFVTSTTFLADASEITRTMSPMRDPVRTEVRIPTRVNDLAAAGHTAVRQAVGELNDAYVNTPVFGGDPAASTGLDRVVEAQLGQRSVGYTIMSVAGIGILVMTGVAALVVSAFLARKRRPETAVLRSRGISTPQLLALSAIETLIVTAPAALIGWLLGVSMVQGRGTVVSTWAAVAVAVVAGGAMVAATVPDTGRDLNSLVTARGELDQPSRARLIGEVVVLVLALVGVLGIIQRSTPVDAARFDPVILGVPVLVALAGAVITLRLYRYPLAVVSRVVSRLKGLVAVAAMQRVERNPTATALPLLILALGVGTTVFGAIVVTSIGEGQRVAAWQTVGADARFISSERGQPLPDEVLSTPAAVTSPATRGNLFVGGENINSATILGFVIDADGYQEVISGSPLASLPSPLLDVPEGVAPVVARRGEIGGRRVSVGDRLTLRFGGSSVEAEIVAVRDSFPTMSNDAPWLIASRDHLMQLGDLDLPINELLVRGPEGDFSTASSETVDVLSRQGTLDGYRSAPLVGGTTNAFRVLSVYSAVLVALAIGAGLVMTANTRRRDFGFLRTLGMSRRQVAASVAIELAVSTVVGILLGVVSGIGVARLITPSLELSAFYEDVVPTVLSIDSVMLAMVGVAALLLVGLATILVTVLLRREAVLTALRVGET